MEVSVWCGFLYPAICSSNEKCDKLEENTLSYFEFMI